jgi:membrane protease YdiL (CAAX protease family)
MEIIEWLFEQPWFWPQDERDDANILNRLGRVFHWTWVAISGVLFAVAAFNGGLWIWRRFSQYDGYTDDLIQGFIFGLVSGVATWMIGRGVRYVFSGE